MRFLFLLFVIMPIAEMWVLIKVGGYIGALPTIALVVLTATLGIALLRQQGLSTLWRARQRMDSGELPAQEIIEGLLLAVGGALLLTPGFITDTIGFACLLPGVRRWLVARLARHFVMVQSGRGHDHFQESRDEFRKGPFEAPPSRDRHTIEGDFKRHDEP